MADDGIRRQVMLPIYQLARTKGLENLDYFQQNCAKGCLSALGVPSVHAQERPFSKIQYTSGPYSGPTNIFGVKTNAVHTRTVQGTLDKGVSWMPSWIHTATV